MRLIELKEDQGAVLADFETENGFFGIVIYESDGESCLQLINDDGVRSKPVTHRQWFKLSDRIAQIKEQAELIGLNLKKEDLKRAIEIVLIRIENDPQIRLCCCERPKKRKKHR